MRLKPMIKAVGTALFAVLLAMACSTVPVTGRRQLDLVPSDQIMAMSAEQYQKFMAEHEVITGTDDARMVKRVGERISSAVKNYLAGKGKSDILAGYKWEFNLVNDPSVNAWAMPGGKVVVYTGILPVAQNENGLATVMGHEVAHAVAQHGNERMSQGLLTHSQNPSQTNNLFMAAYGMGTQIGVLLPYSRLQESEADQLGLIFMAMAGYDPRQALGFWQRMAAQSKGGSPPEFLSTHPAHDTRIERIEKYLPEAMKYYRQ